MTIYLTVQWQCDMCATLSPPRMYPAETQANAYCKLPSFAEEDRPEGLPKGWHWAIWSKGEAFCSDHCYYLAVIRSKNREIKKLGGGQ